MCGICAIHAYEGEENPSTDELITIRDAMAARGPDAAGIWLSPDSKTILGHRRLSIIDLSNSANQPLSIKQGLTISYNGEIYNYKTLRDELIEKGYRFTTNGDTEVILALYHCYGPAMLRKLRGMFAFVLHDKRTGEIFAARDAFGIKPLYYNDNGKVLRIASSVKALSKGHVSSEKDDAAIAGFLMLGSVPEPFTILKNVKALRAGEFLLVKPGAKPIIKEWYNLADIINNGANDNALSDEEIANTLRESVKEHMVADTPVGVFLSAGIDSTTILGLLKDSGFTDIKTITARFSEFEGKSDDESVLAAKTAEFYGTDHTERLITRAEFDADFTSFLTAMDQPTIDGLNTWFVSKAACESGLKVCLSGLGADELFGGYPSFHEIPKWHKRSRFLGPAGFRRPLAENLARIAEKININIHPKAFALAGNIDSPQSAWLVRRGLFMPWEIKDILGQKRAQAALEQLQINQLINNTLTPDPQSDFGQVILMESGLYMRNQLLRDSDWAAMAHSLEVRVPFVDRALFERLAPSLSRHHAPGKQVLPRTPKSGFPQALLNRAKTGFVLPIGEWTQSHSSDLSTLFKSQRLRGHWSRKWALEILRRSGALLS